MFGKHALLIVLIAAALFGPAIYFNMDWSNLSSIDDAGYAVGHSTSIPARTPSSFDLSPKGLSQQVSTIQVAPASITNSRNPARVGMYNSPPPVPFTDNVILPGNANGPDFNAVPLEFLPVNSLGEIIRFDANPNWIRQRWDRVSMTAGSNGLSGMRVPLVTGVNTYDLFGSLTYYFDKNQVPQKIAFRGWTGNPQGLIDFVTTKFDFKNQPSSGAGLYVAKSWRKSTGALYMQHPTVVRQSNPTQQVAILLEINNPDGPFELSTEVASMIFNSPR